MDSILKNSIIQPILKLGVLCIVVFLFGTTLLAQKVDSIQLHSVIISAERPSGIPALKSVEIDSSILFQNQNTNLGAILTNHSTLTIKDYGPSGIQTPTFRGMSASHTKIYLNGLDISPGSLGQSDLSIIPSFLFDGVSLKFGNTAFTEGPGAIGGGVMLKSKPQLSYSGSSLAAGFSTGSFGNRAFNFQYGYKTSKIQSVTRYIFQKAENNFKYRNIAQPQHPVVKQEHADRDLHGLSQSINYNLNHKNQIGLVVLGTISRRNLPALMTDTKGSKQSQEDGIVNTQLSWKHYGENYNSNLVAGYMWSTLTYKDEATNTNAITINQRVQLRENYTQNLSKKWAVKSTLLLDYSTAENVNLKGQNNQFQSSVLVGFNGHLTKKWELGAFIQPTLNNVDFELLPMLSLAFLPTSKKNIIIGFNIAQNVHFPTLNDLYWMPGGNPELESEKSTNAEINLQLKGLIGEGLNWKFDVSSFYGMVDNWILWQPSNKGYWEPQNVKQVEHSGAETSIGFSKKVGTWDLNFNGSYQFVNAVNKGVVDETLNKQLIYTPKHTAQWLLGVKRGQYWANVNYTFTDKRYITTSNSTYLPAYDLVNFSAGFQLDLTPEDVFSIQFDVNNVLNKEYMSVAYRAMPGINYLITLKYTFK